MISTTPDNLASTLFEYDDFGNQTKKTVKLADVPTIANSRITEFSNVFESRADGVYQVSETTNYTAAGTAISQSVATQVSNLSATIERKTIRVDARGNVFADWSEFAGATIRLQKSQIPTAENLARVQVVDGFITQQIDHSGTTRTFSRQFISGENAKIVLTQTDGRENAITISQNVLGQTLQTVDATGNTTTTEYDFALGKPSRITDALGKTHCYKYDLRGNVVAEFGTGTQPAVFAYDDAGNKILQTLFRAGTEIISADPQTRTDGDTTEWHYDAGTNLLLYKRFPDGGEINYTYDAYNRVLNTICSREVSAGIFVKSTRTYAEKTGEVIEINYSDGTATETYAYNFLGQLVRVDDARGSTALAYDDFGALISESQTGFFSKLLERHFDDFGRDVGYSIDGARKQTISYDPASGRIVGMSAGAQNFSWEYLAGTDLKSKLTYPNAATAEWTYEQNRDLLARVKNTFNSATISQYDYENDALGRRISMTKSGSMMASSEEELSYSYNDRSELTGATSDSVSAYNYAYDFDNIGNRNSAGAGVPTENFDYSANSLNQYTEISTAGESVANPLYDSDGNQTLVRTSSGTWEIEYDAKNRPVVWTNTETGAKIYMMFDSQGRRVEKRVLNATGHRTLRERYVYNGYLCVQALNGDSGNSVVKEFVWDPTEPTATRPLSFKYAPNGLNLLYAFDGNKNVSDVFFLAVQNGIAAHYEYSPFGEITRTAKNTSSPVDIISQNPFRFSSEFYDSELDLIYYNFRHYSPALGRFLSRDSIEEHGGLNLYAFVGNNPIENRDWTGQASFKEGIMLVCAVGLYDAYIANKLATEASKKTYDLIGKGELTGPHNGSADAFRHCYWSCRLAKEIGKEQAKKVGDIHEECGCGPDDENYMDLYNNAKGREFSGTSKECEERCYSAILKKDLQLELGESHRGEIYYK